MSQKNLVKPSQYTRKKIQNFSYGLSDQIGKGYSSQVYKGRNDITESPVAIKVIDMNMLKSEINKELLTSEIQILKRMKNYPNILTLHEVYTTRNNTYIITELCQSDLSKIIKNKMTQTEVIKCMKQFLQGYSYILKESIVHRDLKPANLLLTPQNILKIADFGFAVNASEVIKPSKYNVGSPLYMAPESLKKNEYSFKTDVWSIGVIFYEMLTKQTPWKAKNEKQLIKKIEQQKIDSILVKTDFSQPIKDFITRCLTIDKNARISPEEMIKLPLGYDEPIPMILSEKKLNLTFKYETFNSEIGTPNKSGDKIKVFNCRDNGRSFNIYQNVSNKSEKSIPKIQKVHEEGIKTQKFMIQNIQNPFELEGRIQKQQERQIRKQQKKNISKILIAEVHFCRFLFKLLIRMKESINFGILGLETNTKEINNIFQFYTKLIQAKLYQIIEFQNNNFLSIKPEIYHQYKDTSDYKKLLKISRQYIGRYSEELSEYWIQPIQAKSFNWKNFIETSTTISLISYLRTKLENRICPSNSKDKNTHIRRHSSKQQSEQVKNQVVSKYSKDIIILDYLMTSKQLLDIVKDNPNDHERFARKSRIQQIVEGATANIDFLLYSKIMERATLILDGEGKNQQVADLNYR